MTAPGSKHAFEQSYDAIMAMDEREITYCNIPIDAAVAEATQLTLMAVQDRKALLGAGIDVQILGTIARRTGALAYTACQYQMAIEKDPETAKRWKEESPAGYELRKYLVKYMSFAFRNNRSLSLNMKKIREGRGHKDMVLDLLSLNIMAEENMALLAQIPMFDREFVPAAREMYIRLSELLAKSNANMKEVLWAKDVFHRAWSYYKQAADEVKVHAQFVFEGTERYQRYINDYLCATEFNTAAPLSSTVINF